MKNYLSALLLLAMITGFTACFNDLNAIPLDEDAALADVVYNDPAAYEQVLAKIYAGLAVTGQQGGGGQQDIAGIDEGFSAYLRQHWMHQELTTDEAVIAWNDGNIHDLEEMDWTPSNEFVSAMYNRIFFQVGIANEFIRESSEEKIAERGQAGDDATRIAEYRAEARFLRALSYWHALDMFRNVPFVTDEDEVRLFFPEQTNAEDLFSYIESELLDIEDEIVAARQNVYGRADQGAVWMLLAKLYLNAEAYTSTDYYADCLTYCQRIIDAGYELEEEYRNLFVADNHISPESIFAVNFDGRNTQSFGGTTFLVHAALGGELNAADYGVDFTWGGLRVTSALVEKYPSVGGGGLVITAPVDANNTYELLNVPGAYQGWDPTNNDNVLARKGDDNQYTGYIYFAPDAESFEFKFALGSWDNAFGRTDDGVLVAGGGDNISVPEAGFYRAVVDLDALTYSLTKVSFGIIGSATPGGWDEDTDMVYNSETNAWELTLALIGGQEFKFRANDAWDINLGDDGTDGLLEINGGNIAVTRDGIYKVSLFLGKPDLTYGVEIPSSDGRALFFTEGQTLDIVDVSKFEEGYALPKWTNKTRDGVTGSDLTFPDTDFIMFRLGDVYLMAAEAILRTGGDRSAAVEYVNRLRRRAYGNEAGNIQNSDVSLPFLLDERARELAWEGHRRTDLVRYGLFTGDEYVWPFKGGALEGTSVPAYRDVFPLPASDIGANPNLVQNPGY